MKRLATFLALALAVTMLAASSAFAKAPHSAQTAKHEDDTAAIVVLAAVGLLVAGSALVPLGILLAAVITKALHSLDVTFSLPLIPILVFAVVATLAGMLAAILPARRASRLNVLRALQYE